MATRSWKPATVLSKGVSREKAAPYLFEVWSNSEDFVDEVLD